LRDNRKLLQQILFDNLLQHINNKKYFNSFAK